VGLHWAWYALALVGVYRMTAAGFEAVVRHIVRIASQASAEHRSATPTAGPPVAVRLVTHHLQLVDALQAAIQQEAAAGSLSTQQGER
jgi:hypothetical protein